MDKYANFAALSRAEKEDADFRVRIISRPGTTTVVISPHGGAIEPGTSEIADAIAGDDLSLADFAGIKNKGNGVLHITSTNFDEPRCASLVQSSDSVLAIHGEDSSTAVAYLGGKDAELGGRIRDALVKSGFAVEKHPNPDLQGLADTNICNRNKKRAGVQLELSRGLRETLFEGLNAAGRRRPKPDLVRFANAVREGLGAAALPPEEESDQPLFFRAGARAEYLAQYVLSKFGAAVLIPRQEDHGFDVYCSIDVAAENELSDFRHAYYVQIKHGTPKAVSFGGSTSGKKKKWRKGEVHWLLNLDIPLLLGFVDLEQQTVKLFQTSARWLLYYQAIDASLPFQVSLEPSESVSEPTAKPSQSEGAEIIDGHDKNHWHVTLGPPLLEIQVSQLSIPESVVRVKTFLTNYVELERRNIAHRELKTQYADWICRVDWDQKPFQRAWVIESKKFPAASAGQFNRECGPYLAMLIFRLAAAANQEALKNACALFRQLEPNFSLPENLKKLLTDILAKN